MHDLTVNRTTNGKCKISQLSFAAARALDAGAWFSEKFRGERIPTLDEVLETVGRQLYMNMELTNYATPDDGLVPKVNDLVKKHVLIDRLLFSSFFVRNLQITRLLLPDVPLGIRCKRGILGSCNRAFALQGDYFATHPHLDDVDSGLISRVQSAGKRVHVWTVNQIRDLQRMIRLGVDGIITDDPVLALNLLRKSI